MTQYQQNRNLPCLQGYTNAITDNILFNKLNCCRVGIVEEFIPDQLLVRVKIANQIVTDIDEEGNLISEDYAPITAKVYFMGNQNMGVTMPINIGDEGILLFCDREIESWYTTGTVLPPQYLNRAHNITDAIFICGLHSLPKLPKYVAGCINLWYNDTSLQISDEGVTVNGNLTVTGECTANGIPLSTHKHTSGAEGSPTSTPIT